MSKLSQKFGVSRRLVIAGSPLALAGLSAAIDPAGAVENSVAPEFSGPVSVEIVKAVALHRKIADYVNTLSFDLDETMTNTPAEATRSPRVQIANILREGGEKEPCWAHSHEEIDAEVNDWVKKAKCVCLDDAHIAVLEEKRRRLHAELDADEKRIVEAAEGCGLAQKRRTLEQFEGYEQQAFTDLLSVPIDRVDDARAIAAHLMDFIGVGYFADDDPVHRFVMALAGREPLPASPSEKVEATLG